MDNCWVCVVVDKVGMSPHFSVAQSKQSGTVGCDQRGMSQMFRTLFQFSHGGRGQRTERGKWTDDEGGNTPETYPGRLLVCSSADVGVIDSEDLVTPP